MSANETSKWDLADTVAVLLAARDAAAFATGLQLLIDSGALAAVPHQFIIDIPLFWMVRRAQPSIEVTERFLGFLFRYQDQLPRAVAVGHLLRHLLAQVLGCDEACFEGAGPTEKRSQDVSKDYWLISRYICAGIGDNIVMPPQVEVARDNCWFVHRSEYVQACRSLCCLKYSQKGNVDPRFGSLIGKYIDLTESHLREIGEVYKVPTLRWERALLESLDV